MGAQSKIEWTDSTFNPWVGCTKVARARGAPSACDFCYAEKWAKRSGQVEWGNHPRRRTTEAYWRNPSAWNNRARLFQAEHGRRQRDRLEELPDDEITTEFQYLDKTPVFFGHYWMPGEPMITHSTATCLDFSVARKAI